MQRPDEPPPEDPARSASFPLRAAAIDVGSNAIRFLAAEFSEPGRWTGLDFARAPVRLGAEAFRSGRLADDAMEGALAALADFRRRMDALGIRHYRAVATSAVRDSRNGRALAERALERARIRLEAISGTEEARLAWRAIRSRHATDGRDWVLVDLGGGSMEVSLVDAGGVCWSESHPLGTVRLLEELGPDAAQSPERVGRHLDEHPGMLRLVEAVGGRPGAGVVATGGNIEDLTELARSPADERGVRRLPLQRLRELIDELASLTPAERVERLGLREDRADVIVQAAVVYARVAELAGADELVVPGVGVREGALEALVDELAEPAPPAPRAAPAEAPAADGPPRRLTVALLSDVHANLPALRSALHLAEQRGAERVVVAGDLVGDGPHPAEVVGELRRRGVHAIRGNVDRKVLAQGTRRGKLEKRLEGKGKQRRNRAWAALQLLDAPEERDWLEALPEQLDLELAGVRLLVVHGSPHGDTDYVFPSLTPEGLEGKLEPVEGPRPAVLVCGHSHVPFAREVGGVWVVNCGSVGRPADGDPRGSLALLELEAGRVVRAEVVRVAYPVQEVTAALAERRVPGIDPDEYERGIKG